MIEIPESQNLKKQFAVVLDKPVANVRAGGTPHKFAWFSGDPSAYGALLNGRSFDSAVSHAGYVELRAGDVKLILGEGVNVRYFAPGEAIPVKSQLDMRFEDGSARSYAPSRCTAGCGRSKANGTTRITRSRSKSPRR